MSPQPGRTVLSSGSAIRLIRNPTRMKNNLPFTIAAFLFLGIAALQTSCQKSTASDPTIQILVVETTAATDITQTTATSGGNVATQSGASVTARGIVWSTSPNPTITDNKTSDGTGLGTYTSSLTGLTPNTPYYVRAYVAVGATTGYANSVTFTTKKTIPTSVADVDGNVYNVVTIGTQIWMKENLGTTKYKDGTAITFPGANNSAWQSNTTGAYAWYNNDIANKPVYGGLYNWYAVNTTRLCPTDWHVPSDAEWSAMTASLGGANLAGGKLKEMGTAHWNTPNAAATNDVGFSALPGGSRNLDGTSNTIGFNGYQWTATEASSTDAWSRYEYYGDGFLYRYSYIKSLGFSVRCVLD